jgi:hypothetical protein
MKYDKICVMLPTYGRAATKLPVFIRSLIEKTDDISLVCICFVVNEEDTETVKAIGVFCNGVVEYEILYERTKECNLAYYFNLAYDKTKFNDPGTCVSMFGDDMVFVTRGWESLMLEKINDACGFGIVYGDDDYCQHEKLCVYFIATRAYISLFGKHFMCPEFGADWIDTIHMEIAKELNCAWYIPNLHIRHEHFTKTNEMDVTTVRNRIVATKVHQKKNMVNEFSSEIAENVKNKLKQIDFHGLTFVMTTYDRIPILERMAVSWNKAVLIPEITVYDDCSVRIKEVRKIVSNMRNAKLCEGSSHLGCEENNVRALRCALKEKETKGVVVIDSDACFSGAWIFKVLALWNHIQNNSWYAGGSIFNTNTHAAIPDGESINGYVNKKIIGGLGAIYKRETIEQALLNYDSTKKSLTWDNTINDWVVKNDKAFLCSEKSHIQHIGFFQGLHTSDLRLGDYAEDFAGKVEPMRSITTGFTGGPVLFAVMARLGDVVAASMIANMLMSHGVDLTWLIIPKYAELLHRIAPGAKVIVSEPMAGGPQGDWSETNTSEMKIKYPNYSAHINAQIGARENHNEYTSSGLSPCDYMKMICEDVTGIALDKNYSDFLFFDDSGVGSHIDIKKLPENLAIIAPQAITCPVITPEIAEEIFRELKAEGYNVRLLVPNRPERLPTSEIRNKYIYRQPVERCIVILQRAKMFVGSDSGMSWCALYSKCEKRIYHKRERLRKTNTHFSVLDFNAKDVVI